MPDLDLADLPGAFVVSLDFELLWGVRDRIGSQDAYMENIIGARQAVPRLLALFEGFEIAATWAIVGCLFATSRAELEAFTPKVRANYTDQKLSPYEETVGEGEWEDPLHFAWSLIELIQNSPRQEIATHTFSHYYCGERGQDHKTFRADLEAACGIAARRGLKVRSIVFPRNQHNPLYDDILLENEITAYRGNPVSSAWSFANGTEGRMAGKRMRRLLGAYIDIGGPQTLRWNEVLQPNGLSNVRASTLLRPFRPSLRPLEPLRLRRIKQGINHAAKNREIFHLWWHPHNFGSYIDENLDFLRKILSEVHRCQREHGMISLSINGVDEMVHRISTVQ